MNPSKFYVVIRVVPELKILTILPDRTSKSIIVNVQPHPVQRPFWQASLFHLPPKGCISLTPAILCATVCYSDNIDSITLIFCEDNPDANLLTKN